MKVSDISNRCSLQRNLTGVRGAISELPGFVAVMCLASGPHNSLLLWLYLGSQTMIMTFTMEDEWMIISNRKPATQTLLIRPRIIMHEDRTNNLTSNWAGGLIKVEPRRCSWVEGLPASERSFGQQLEASPQDVAGYSELRTGRQTRSENAAFVEWPKCYGILVYSPSLSRPVLPDHRSAFGINHRPAMSS